MGSANPVIRLLFNKLIKVQITAAGIIYILFISASVGSVGSLKIIILCVPCKSMLSENTLLKCLSTYCFFTPSKGSVKSETPLKYNESLSVIQYMCCLKENFHVIKV